MIYGGIQIFFFTHLFFFAALNGTGGILLAIAFIIKKCKARNGYRVADLEANDSPPAEGEEVGPEDRLSPIGLENEMFEIPIDAENHM